MFPIIYDFQVNNVEQTHAKIDAFLKTFASGIDRVTSYTEEMDTANRKVVTSIEAIASNGQRLKYTLQDVAGQMQYVADGAISVSEAQIRMAKSLGNTITHLERIPASAGNMESARKVFTGLMKEVQNGSVTTQRFEELWSGIFNGKSVGSNAGERDIEDRIARYKRMIEQLSSSELLQWEIPPRFIEDTEKAGMAFAKLIGHVDRGTVSVEEWNTLWSSVASKGAAALNGLGREQRVVVNDMFKYLSVVNGVERRLDTLELTPALAANTKSAKEQWEKLSEAVRDGRVDIQTFEQMYRNIPNQGVAAFQRLPAVYRQVGQGLMQYQTMINETTASLKQFEMTALNPENQSKLDTMFTGFVKQAENGTHTLTRMEEAFRTIQTQGVGAFQAVNASERKLAKDIESYLDLYTRLPSSMFTGNELSAANPANAGAARKEFTTMLKLIDDNKISLSDMNRLFQDAGASGVSALSNISAAHRSAFDVALKYHEIIRRTSASLGSLSTTTLDPTKQSQADDILRKYERIADTGRLSAARITEAYNDAAQSVASSGNAMASQFRAANAAEQDLYSDMIKLHQLMKQAPSSSILGQLQRDVANSANSLMAAKQLTKVMSYVDSGKITSNEMLKLFNDVEQRGIQVVETSTGVTRKAAQEIVGYFDTVRSVTDKTNRAGHQLMLTWQNIFRLVQIQVAHMLISKMIASYQGATTEASKFERQLAQITTIQGDVTKSTREWGREVVDLSNTFATGLGDSAEASYEALSNQVVEAGTAMHFMRDAGYLALTTVSTLEDSVNSLSSALNSYGLQSLESEYQSALFFRTVDLGRVKLNELANDYGNSAALANQLSVSIEELDAGLVVLTRSGVKVSVAQTLMNNVMQKMLRPSEEMKELFKEWGVASGEAAIQTYGFLGVLSKVIAESQKAGGSARLGELFQEMRALRGISGLADVKIFSDTLTELGGNAQTYEEIVQTVTSTLEEYRKQQAKITDSIGFKYDQMQTKLKNVIVAEFAPELLKDFVDADEAMGGLANRLRELVRPILIVSDGLTTLTGVMGGLQDQTNGLMRTMPMLATLVVGAFTKMKYGLRGNLLLFAGLTALDLFLSQWYNTQADTLEEAKALYDEHYKEINEAMLRSLQQELVVTRKYNDLKIAEMRRYFAAVENQMKTMEDKIFRSNDPMDDVVNSFVPGIIPEKAFRDADEYKSHWSDILGELLEATGQFNYALNETGRFKNLIKDLEDARDKVKDLKKELEELTQKQTDDLFEAKLSGATGFTKQQMLEDEVKKLLEEGTKESLARAAELEKQRIAAAGEGAKKLGFSYTPDTSTLEKIHAKQQELAKKELDDAEKNQAKLEEQVRQEINLLTDKMRAELKILETNQKIREEKEKILQLQEQLNKAVNENKEAKGQLTLDQQAAIKDVMAQYAAMGDTLKNQNPGMWENIGNTLGGAAAMRSGSKDLPDTPDQKELAPLLPEGTDLSQFGSKQIGQQIVPYVRALAAELETYMQDMGIKPGEEPEWIKQRQAAIQSMIEKLGILIEAKRKLEANLGEGSNLDAQVKTNETLIDNYRIKLQLTNDEEASQRRINEQLADRLKMYEALKNSLPNNINPPGYATGGYIGGPTGSDNQMIMAHRGEMVMNRAATNAYAPILQAMNSLSNTTNLGGLTVNFNGANVSSPRALAAALHREITILTEEGRSRV